MSMDSSSIHHLIRAVDYNISYAETETAGVMSTAVESHKWVLIVDAVILVCPFVPEVCAKAKVCALTISTHSRSRSWEPG